MRSTMTDRSTMTVNIYKEKPDDDDDDDDGDNDDGDDEKIVANEN